MNKNPSLAHAERSKVAILTSIATSNADIADSLRSSSTAEMVDKQGFNIMGAIDDQTTAIEKQTAAQIEAARLLRFTLNNFLDDVQIKEIGWLLWEGVKLSMSNKPSPMETLERDTWPAEVPELGDN